MVGQGHANAYVHYGDGVMLPQNLSSNAVNFMVWLELETKFGMGFIHQLKS